MLYILKYAQPHVPLLIGSQQTFTRPGANGR